ncbi:MAG TPA: NAD(P)H-binding protein [Dinghuibacter sp.]|uniref:NmrA family NAD(P)-binding protein n=1 Tax=Dinghuibacter sp. TaxID=2024697 RepID=UPI002BCF8E32|nr:NAD(P)H-binding protein [Dinghuibacter sp.]HTJ12644.1 NAD(P)H-binding protein [Dinghuibacter sp.]
MKLILTGSLGHIGHPLTTLLTQQGHTVTVITTNPAKQKEIEALGATAAIGRMEDTGFLTTTFRGADAVYCMVPPAQHTAPDRVAYYRETARNYARAIQDASIQRAIHLSSIGADLDKGTGIILGAYEAEQVFNALDGVSVTHIRPTYFNYNLLNFAGMIRKTGRIMANYGGDDIIPLVEPADIAPVIAEELQKTGKSIRYVASEERSGNEIARTLGEAIGKPDLSWTVITDDQMRQGMEANGMPAGLAADLTEMYSSMHKGDLGRDFQKHKPQTWGATKLEAFLPTFVEAYNNA